METLTTERELFSFFNLDAITEKYANEVKALLYQIRYENSEGINDEFKLIHKYINEKIAAHMKNIELRNQKIISEKELERITDATKRQINYAVKWLEQYK